MTALNNLAGCDYTAFISYAHADDVLEVDWIAQFKSELERGLAAALRGVDIKPLHLSAENGPEAGILGEQLKERVARSFAMIIVVHQNYAVSECCLKELEYFRSLFGDAGCRRRLFIVALAKGPMLQVASGDAWKRLLPYEGEQLWMPFYDPERPDRAMDIYINTERRAVISPAFKDQFFRLRGALVERIKESIADDRLPMVPRPLFERGPAPTAAAGPSVVSGAPALILPAEKSLVSATTVSLGFMSAGDAQPPALATAAAQFAQRGIAVKPLRFEDLSSDFEGAFEGTSHLVLPFDDSPLMMARRVAGGHLQIIQEAWVQERRDASRVFWLDLRPAVAPGAAPAPPPPGSASAHVASLGAEPLSVDALARRLAPAPRAAHADVRLYIESNRHELTVWQTLGEQIARRWQQLLVQFGTDQAPGIQLRPRGLPVDRIDEFPSLDDADGVVLLWGKKTADTLVAQINKVENKMAPGRDAAPGVVAFLMPPQNDDGPVPAWGWQVLRVAANDDDALDVVREEETQLSDFLRKVLQRRLQRDPVAVN